MRSWKSCLAVELILWINCNEQAKRSATECAAILDISQKLGLIETEKLNAARDLLFRIVSMLIKLVSAAH